LKLLATVFEFIQLQSLCVDMLNRCCLSRNNAVGRKVSPRPVSTDWVCILLISYCFNLRGYELSQRHDWSYDWLCSIGWLSTQRTLRCFHTL